jgi:hypothetical protein
MCRRILGLMCSTFLMLDSDEVDTQPLLLKYRDSCGNVNHVKFSDFILELVDYIKPIKQ